MIIAPDLDWEGIEREYRAGVLTLREIAGRFGTTHSSIHARAKKYGWDRDLAAKIRAKAEALVTQRGVYKTKSAHFIQIDPRGKHSIQPTKALKEKN